MTSLPQQICNDLMIQGSELYSIANTKTRIYRQFPISKRSGGQRTIHSASPEAKLIQLWLAQKVFKVIDTTPFAFAYREGCSITKNAEAHMSNDYILKFDIEGFFPAIRYEMFESLLLASTHSLPAFAKDDLDKLFYLVRKFCFLRDGSLPQGFCSSPAISNIVMKDYDQLIWQKVQKISKETIFTRYADDLCISFKDFSHKEEIEKAVNEVFAATVGPFKLNKTKTKLGRLRTGTMFVTGLKICSDR